MAALASALTMPAEGKLWVQHPKGAAWRLVDYKAGAVLDAVDKMSGARLCELGVDGGAIQLPVSRTAAFDHSHELNLPDISRMSCPHEAPLMSLLRRRFCEDVIYTKCGNVMISVNPYKNIPRLYDLVKHGGGGGGGGSKDPPHIFDIAARAMASVNAGAGAQAILVNGESGAGKTEATKRMLSYLVWLNSSNFQNPTGADRIEDLVMSSNEVFEAFGNAATVNNINSSRFGKFLQLRLKPMGGPDGAHFISGVAATQFLLETSRLSLQAPGEQNFRILYQLVAGASEAQRIELRLRPSPQDYAYLADHAEKGATAAAAAAEDEDDEDSVSQQFGMTVSCMAKLGFDDALISSVMRVLSGILALGNVRFIPKTDDSDASKVDEASLIDLEDAKELLGWKDQNIAEVLTCRTTSAGLNRARAHRRTVSVQYIPLTFAQASAARDGLAKIIYSSLFDLIFETFNKTSESAGTMPAEDVEAAAAAAAAASDVTFTASANPADAAATAAGDDVYIGILDIFGFEILERNNYEQLCINYANEALQSLFNEHMFVYEFEMYSKEGIDCEHITYKDNGDLMSLFVDKTNAGIFPLIDEQGLLGARGSDAAVLANLNKAHSRSGKDNPGHPCYARPKLGNESFIVRHYAGDVEYHVESLLAKNNDDVHHDLKAIGRNSTFSLVQQLMESYDEKRSKKAAGKGDDATRAAAEAETETETKNEITAPTSNSTCHQLLGSTTISQRVCLQMNELSDIIASCTPHFVRCIKPNHGAKPCPSWDDALVFQQLRFLGLMETCRIRREGYPVRKTFQQMALQFSPLVPKQELQKPDRAEYEWHEYVRDEDNAPYYYNATTQVTTWTRPEGVTDEDILKEYTPRRQTEAMLTQLLGTPGVDGYTGWQAGTTCVFMRDEELETLERTLAEYFLDEENRIRDRATKAIQAAVRQRAAKNLLEKLRQERKEDEVRELAERIQREEEEEKQRQSAAVKLQALMRAREVRKKAFLKRQQDLRRLASVKIQSITRGRSQAKLFGQKKQVIVKMQSLKRMRSRRASLVRKRTMLVKVQSQMRMKAASKWRGDAIKLTIKVQAAYRGLVVRNRYAILRQAREQWKKFLSPNEAVVFASLVRKEAGGGIAKLLGFKKRRQLLLTTKPRFLYVDPNDETLKGNIDATNDDVHIALGGSSDSEGGKGGSQDFILITADRDYSFTDLLGEARQWRETLMRYQEYRRVSQRGSALGSRALMKSFSRAEGNGGEAKEGDSAKSLPMCIGVGDMLRNGWGIQESLLVQGYLTKQSVKGRFGKKWTKRWFVLHNGSLYYFKSEYVVFTLSFTPCSHPFNSFNSPFSVCCLSVSLSVSLSLSLSVSLSLSLSLSHTHTTHTHSHTHTHTQQRPGGKRQIRNQRAFPAGAFSKQTALLAAHHDRGAEGCAIVRCRLRRQAQVDGRHPTCHQCEA
jgi:myosin-5